MSKQKTWDQFFEEHSPIKNHIDDNASLNGCIYETFGRELDFVAEFPSNRVCTYIDGDEGEPMIVTGYHVVNRIGYLILQEPWVEESTYADEVDED